MKNALSYKGFVARIDFDSVDNIFVGRVLDIRDIIGFHGETVSKLTSDFHNAIEHYLQVCNERGVSPEKPYSGNLMLRVHPEIHAAAAIAAESQGKSLNQWAANVLKKAAEA